MLALNGFDAGLFYCPKRGQRITRIRYFSDDPYADFARATHLFDNRPEASKRVHNTAVVADSAKIGDGVTIDAGTVIEDDVVLADNVWVGWRVDWLWYSSRGEQ